MNTGIVESAGQESVAPLLPVHLINLTLQYLLPPTGPLPPHLISRELLQRHHFLSISPSDPEAYFCWPTNPPTASDIVHDLELRAGNDDLLHKPSHDITYVHSDDGTESRARVKLADDLDIYVMFVWQGADEPGSAGEAGWRYYDLKRIQSPQDTEFSPASTSTAANASRLDGPKASGEAAGAAASGNLHLTTTGGRASSLDPEHVFGSSPDHDAPELTVRSSSPSSDAYWDNYGGPSSRDSPTQATTSLPSSYNRDGKQKTEEEEEAEYWATYSSVQGTADSTIPSRVPSTRKFASFVPHDELDQLGLDPLSMREQWMGEQAGDGDGYGYDYNEEYDRPMSYAVGRASEGAFASSSGAVPEPSLWAPSASTALPTSSSSNDARDVDSRVLRRLSPPQERQEWQVPEADERDATNASALAKALVPVIAYQDHLEEVERSRSATASAEGSVKSSGDIDMDTEVVTDSPAPKADVLPPSSSSALVCKESLTAADTAVISSVRGLYALWQAQRSSASKEETNSSDRDAFMELVRQAVDTQ